MRNVITRLFILLAALATFLTPAFGQAQQEAYYARVGGVFVAANYANYSGLTLTANTGTGAQTYTVQFPGALRDGNALPPFYVNEYLTWDQGANAETVQITTVSSVTCPGGGGGGGANPNCWNITSTFANAHGTSTPVASGHAGLDEAIYAAQLSGGGLVSVDTAWTARGGTSAMITAAPVFQNVAITDTRSFAQQYWTLQGNVTPLGTPATLSAVTALPSSTPVGAFGTGTYHMCVAYVDVMGQEGTCSLDFSQAGLATGSFIFSPPAASTGAVGYTIYIGLTGGGVTNLDYKVPLTTQPTVVGAYPVSNGVCTLTTVETTTPACAVTNTNYNQTGSTATVSVITLSTSPINPQTTVVSTTSIYVPNPGGRTVYIYTPSSHIGTPGLVAGSLAFPITTAELTVVPDVAGTINIPPGFMNYVGRTVELCGEATSTASAATIVDIQFQWDSIGANTAGKGVLIGDLTATPTTALVTGKATFCYDFMTTVASASATGGSINHVGGSGAVGGITLVAGGAFSDAQTSGATGSLNLAGDARINVIVLHTTSTDGAGWILQGLTLKVLN